MYIRRRSRLTQHSSDAFGQGVRGASRMFFLKLRVTFQGPAGDLVSLLFRPLVCGESGFRQEKLSRQGNPLRPDRSSLRASRASYLPELIPAGTCSPAVSSVRQLFLKAPVIALSVHLGLWWPSLLQLTFVKHSSSSWHCTGSYTSSCVYTLTSAGCRRCSCEGGRGQLPN